ncbi:hypothetical protein QQS21_012350 [Conoideocrella luteorostrata]|uniref:Uncharacterized protein n=1 Tax=Conoideocrella luteorostrata TaxID=1105319 RepID=A0AAJ0CBD3_9HYPO|nr:hypothetical protein QQS21_012350 [Conoideocrella luteorostrata]
MSTSENGQPKLSSTPSTSKSEGNWQATQMPSTTAPFESQNAESLFSSIVSYPLHTTRAELKKIAATQRHRGFGKTYA